MNDLHINVKCVSSSVVTMSIKKQYFVSVYFFFDVFKLGISLSEKFKSITFNRIKLNKLNLVRITIAIFRVRLPKLRLLGT